MGRGSNMVLGVRPNREGRIIIKPEGPIFDHKAELLKRLEGRILPQGRIIKYSNSRSIFFHFSN